jgi:hypothetical protein
MAENKRSFLLYVDIIHTVEKLTNEQSGVLFKHILRYVNDKDPVIDNLLVEIAFEPIKQQLKRDLRKYESIVKNRKIAGLASAEKRKQKQQVSTRVNKCQQTSTNSTDIDNDNDNDIVTVIDTDKKKRKCKPFVIPLKEEVRQFFDENGYDPDFGETRWQYYNDANWFDSHGSPVLNWKQKMRSVWFKDEHKKKPSFMMP